VQRALNAAIIEDSKPSQVLRILEQQLEGMEANEPLLKQVFLQKLPTTVRTIVAANSDKMALQELAELADRVYDNIPQESTVMQARSSSADDRISRLENMVEKLIFSVHPSNSSSQSKRNRSRSRTRFNPSGSLCYYHWRYKEKAQKCTSPCTWNSSSHSKN